MEEIKQIGVKAIILTKDKKHFLSVKRSPEKELDFSEAFDIPGGRINHGEEPLDGLTRELEEEIGYTYKSTPILLDAKNIIATQQKHIVRLTYLLPEDIKYTDITIGDEHSSAEIVDLVEHKNVSPILNDAIILAIKYIKKYKSVSGKNG